MGSPAAERGREVRRRLLNAAVELIPERGWTAVSTRTLAERAGVTPSVVHYHFPSLNALMTEAAMGAIREIVGVLRPVLESARTPGEALDGLLGSVEGFAGDDPAVLLFVETYLAATRDERLKEAVAEVFTGFRRELAGWLERNGVAAPEETAAVVMAAIDGLLLHRVLAPAPGGSIPEVMRRLVDRTP